MDSMDEFTNTVEDNIKEVQSLFNEYQNSFFPERSPEFFCLELNGEAGELANAEKKRWKGRVVDDEVYSEEAADVMIALMNYANSRGVNLGKAVKKKLHHIDKERLELQKQGKEY
jgi:NTP pyrophosphatase (non-canonical NTP hydrolase)